MKMWFVLDFTSRGYMNKWTRSEENNIAASAPCTTEFHNDHVEKKYFVSCRASNFHAIGFKKMWSFPADLCKNARKQECWNMELGYQERTELGWCRFNIDLLFKQYDRYRLDIVPIVLVVCLGCRRFREEIFGAQLWSGGMLRNAALRSGSSSRRAKFGAPGNSKQTAPSASILPGAATWAAGQQLPAFGGVSKLVKSIWCI